MTAHLDTFARDNLPPRAQWPDFLFELPELKYPERMNCVVELLDQWVAAGRGNRPCLISPTETLTYAQLAERVNRFGSGLQALGLEMEHRVLIAMTDCIDWIRIEPSRRALSRPVRRPRLIRAARVSAFTCISCAVRVSSWATTALA